MVWLLRRTKKSSVERTFFPCLWHADKLTQNCRYIFALLPCRRPSVKQSTLANQTPGIDADVNFHDEVAKAAGVRLGLVWRVRRNQQPIAGFHLISLAAHHRLSAVFARDDTVLILEVLPIGDFAARDPFNSASV